MQIISHKNTGLTVCQRFFIEKSIELLYIGSIDSYRVKLHNPKTVLEEIRYCLIEFQQGRIKHFHTLKAKEKDKKALLDEAISFLNTEPNYLNFKAISQKYLERLLLDATENNYKKIASAIEILAAENENYLESVIDGLRALISAENTALEDLEKIDLTLNILFSELIHKGYSKGFLYKLLYGIFVKSLGPGGAFDDHFNNFKIRLLQKPTEYSVVFRIDTTQEVYDSLSAIHSSISISDEINSTYLTGSTYVLGELEHFKITSSNRKFIICKIYAFDYLAALKKARSILSEYLDVINLGLSDEFLQIHGRVLVIDSRSPKNGQFQNNVNILDGKYRVEKTHYLEFTKKLPAILNNTNIQNETKEKIKSAIRYLRLGNQSTEVEHKFINYWIGLEYLFSNYESQNTINRVKEHFINAHSLAYVKRNSYSFLRDFEQLSTDQKKGIKSYNNDPACLSSADFYTEIGSSLLGSYPLLAYRALKLKKWFFSTKKPNATEYIKKHRSNLEIHFTRIYRLRNEIIHDAATNTNNEHIASNLRYYLTFILNELIDFFFKITNKQVAIEDYFILNEIEFGNIEHSGFDLNTCLNIDCSIDFIS